MNTSVRLTVSQLAVLKGISRIAIYQSIKHNKYKTARLIAGRGGKSGKSYDIDLYDDRISPEERARYFKEHESEAVSDTPQPGILSFPAGQPVTVTEGVEGNSALAPSPFEPLLDHDVDNIVYSNAANWERSYADKWIRVLHACAGMQGEDLKQFVSQWNTDNPSEQTSYSRILQMRKNHLQEGISGLLPKYGKNAGTTIVQNIHFEHFKSLYLKEGSPSLQSCWYNTLGFAKSIDPVFKPESFPAPYSFFRRLTREVPKESIYLARHGHDAWNRKFANYIPRDYSTMKAGECYVSDHAQVDVAVRIPSGKVCFPWITVWCDFKSQKWLGWLHHAESPNSDHIFQSFYYAVKEHGLPEDVYIDNGKDYRSKDFAGGRQRFIRVSLDESKTSAMLLNLSITPHFSLPYNAQAKIIERTFLKNKEWFSKHRQGYRGGDVTERPEILEHEIKSGKIMEWNEYVALMDQFITGILNRVPSKGKVLQGMCPDELWMKEHTEVRKTSDDALKLFCMRTSRELTIMRNGVRDSDLSVTYWAEEMMGLKGTKVYLRRDINAYNKAYVFEAATDKFICTAQIAESAAALARTDIEKSKLRELVVAKNQQQKIVKAYAAVANAGSASDQIVQMAVGIETVNSLRGYEPAEQPAQPVYRLSNTMMDKVILEQRERERRGTSDLSSIQPPEQKQSRIYAFETDRDYDQQKNKSDLKK